MIIIVLVSVPFAQVTIRSTSPNSPNIPHRMGGEGRGRGRRASGPARLTQSHVLHSGEGRGRASCASVGVW